MINVNDELPSTDIDVLCLTTCDPLVAFIDVYGDWNASGVESSYDESKVIIEGKITYWMQIPTKPISK